MPAAIGAAILTELTATVVAETALSAIVVGYVTVGSPALPLCMVCEQ